MKLAEGLDDLRSLVVGELLECLSESAPARLEILQHHHVLSWARAVLGEVDTGDPYRDLGRQFAVEAGLPAAHVGRRDELPERVLREFESTEAATRQCTGLTFNLAVNYGSRTEIVEAAARMAHDFAEGKIGEDDLQKEETLSRYLYTGGQPDPDLLIRTSGELRLSNFMLWQSAYTEFFFSDLYWPDFGRRELLRAILEYQKRERRYGAGELP